MKSSEKGRGSSGRDAAMRLASSAQSTLTASYRSGQIDVKLAGAAFVSAHFVRRPAHIINFYTDHVSIRVVCTSVL